jgi:hypothetical protein
VYVTAASGPRLVGGTFRDAAQAQAALDALMQEARARQDVEVAFFTSGGEYLLFVSAKTAPAYERAIGVLRAHHALEDSNLNRVAGAARNALVHGAEGTGKTALVVRWIESFLMLQGAGLVEPSDLVALAMAIRNPVVEGASGEAPQPDGDAALLRHAVDAELREVTEQLTQALRREHPDLFDSRGRLRKRTLSKQLTERLGGRRRLSGADLQALEDAADARRLWISRLVLRF